MKIFFSIWIFSRVACFGAQGTSTNEQDEFFAIGIGFKTSYRDYFFRWDQFSSKTSWDSHAEIFPLKLGVEAHRASTFIIGEEHITNEMHLNSVRIRRLNVLKSEVEHHGKSLSDFEKTWIVEMEFLVQPVELRVEPPLKRVLMLLDGSYATKRRIHEPPTESSLTSGSREALLSEDKKKGVDVSPLEISQRPDLKIPNVQWNPYDSELPFDLTSENNHALNYITNRESNFEGSLSLKEISIYNILPYNAAKASHLNVLEHLHHWLVIFSYCDATEKREGGFDVYMLLDGTILNAVARDYCP